MSKNKAIKIDLRIEGMSCASCELLVERRLAKVPGIQQVSVNHASGKAKIVSKGRPDLAVLNRAVADEGYTVYLWGSKSTQNRRSTAGMKDYYEVGAIFLVLLGLYQILKRLDWVPDVSGVSPGMGYGAVIVLGLVAAMSSCIAVSGGLLLAISASHAKANPEARGLAKLRPHISFNVGRVAGYALLGGLLGSMGSVVALSAKATGVLSVGASLVMIVLGFQLLGIFPGLSRLMPKMPKAIGRRIHDWSGRGGKSAPFLLGAATFFLPCGFTQALQIQVLSQGGLVKGALTMGFFALGTVPALMSVGVISGWSKGSFQRYFLRTAGALVILVGLMTVDNGLALAGIRTPSLKKADSQSVVVAGLPTVPMENGYQIAEMDVIRYGYSTGKIRVKAGVPVEWRVDGRQAAGCGRVLTIPELNVTKLLDQDKTTVIRFTPTEPGKLFYNCSMRMMDPLDAHFEVVAADSGQTCNPEFMSCQNG